MKIVRPKSAESSYNSLKVGLVVELKVNYLSRLLKFLKTHEDGKIEVEHAPHPFKKGYALVKKKHYYVPK